MYGPPWSMDTVSHGLLGIIFTLIVSSMLCFVATTKSIAVSIMLFNRGNQQLLGIWSSAREKKEMTCLEAKKSLLL